MGHDMIILGPTITFNVQPFDSSSAQIIVDLSAPPIGLDFGKDVPWQIASAIVTDVNTSNVLYDKICGINERGGPGKGIGKCELISPYGITPVLFELRFNSPPWNIAYTPIPTIFNIALIFQYNGYIAAPVSPSNAYA